MKTIAYATAALMMSSSGSVRAQAPGEARGAAASMPTHLHVSAEGSVSVPPDQLVAELVAQARSASPAEAQGKVNALMKHGMQEAGDVAGVTPQATGYSVRAVDLAAPAASGVRPGAEKPGWEAQQALELRAPSGDQLFDVVGKLQGEGFLVTGLDWRLSPGLSRKARDDAMVEALQALKIRADAAAAVFGLRVDHFQDIQVDVPSVFPIRPIVAMQVKAIEPPQATPSARR